MSRSVRLLIETVCCFSRTQCLLYKTKWDDSYTFGFISSHFKVSWVRVFILRCLSACDIDENSEFWGLVCHINNFPWPKPAKLRSASGCNVLKLISAWNLGFYFCHYREVFQMAHLRAGDPLLNFRDVHTWGLNFSSVLVSVLSGQDKCIVFCLLEEEKAEAPTLGWFFSPSSDFILRNTLSWGQSAFCFQWQSGPATSLSGAGGWWSRSITQDAFAWPLPPLFLPWQLRAPRAARGRGVVFLPCGSGLCRGDSCQGVRLPGLNTCCKVARLWEIKQCWIISPQCNNVFWNQERDWTTKLERLEPIPIVPLANSFFPQAAKNNPAFPLPLTNSNHFYKQIPKQIKIFWRSWNVD